jgi:hypothetical protein
MLSIARFSLPRAQNPLSPPTAWRRRGEAAGFEEMRSRGPGALGAARSTPYQGEVPPIFPRAEGPVMSGRAAAADRPAAGGSHFSLLFLRCNRCNRCNRRQNARLFRALERQRREHRGPAPV